MELKDVIHLYIGCKVRVAPYLGHPTQFVICDLVGLDETLAYVRGKDVRGNAWGRVFHIEKEKVIPVLRKLESITDEEWSLFESALGCGDLKEEFLDNACGYQWRLINSALNFFRENGIDVDGLIDSGQAIDAETLNKADI